MLFSDVIGQKDVKQQLNHMIAEQHVPHALLFAGPEGCGKLPMALAMASRLLCKTPTETGEPCGTCHACHMVNKLAHPDLHFVFPVIKTPGKSNQPVSDEYLPQWRKQIEDTPYFTHQTWLKDIDVVNQQSQIYVAEAANIISKLVNVSSQGGYRVVIIWRAEEMNTEAANKLLKVLEEPPVQTIFILTTDRPEKMLGTILSRTQRIDFPPLSIEDISSALQTRNGLQPEDANDIARIANGNFTRALEEVVMNADTAVFFDMFVLFMRLCYMRKIKDLFEWSIQVSQWGREKQKDFLEYAQRLIRENFMYNFHLPELNYMARKEMDFSKNFARFINENNVIPIMNELSDAQRDITQNVNPRMVFFDFALKMIVLLIQK